MAQVSTELDIVPEHVIMVGKDTNRDIIQDFIRNTLHEPIQFNVTDVQLASVASLSGIRKFNKPVNEVLAKITVAAQACQDIVASGKTYESDLAILATQNAVRAMVATSKDTIFRQAFENLASVEQQNLVYGKAGVKLSVTLQEFIKATNKHLQWDVSDPKDPRNHYRQCPNCDAVYVHITGCHNVYTCGGSGHVPDGEESKTLAMVDVEFVGNARDVEVHYMVDGVLYAANMLAGQLAARLPGSGRHWLLSSTNHNQVRPAANRGARALRFGIDSSSKPPLRVSECPVPTWISWHDDR